MNEMTYEQTVELQRNIAIKNKAREIINGFKKNVTLDLTKKNGLRFEIWSDSHNASYVEIKQDRITYVADFLHENYSVDIEERAIFDGIKSCYRGINHVASEAKVEYNEHSYKIERFK